MPVRHITGAKPALFTRRNPSPPMQLYRSSAQTGNFLVTKMRSRLAVPQAFTQMGACSGLLPWLLAPQATGRKCAA